MAMQCPTCRQMLDDGVRFCPHDGTPLTDTPPTHPGRPAPETTPPLALPVVVGGRYRLEALRGGGGMAHVYRAVDLTLQRPVAVKLINPALRTEARFDARFQREARIASQLADPHIVVVHDFGLDASHGPYLVMEFLQGQSLGERLAADGPLPLKAVLQLAGQLLLALVHAHDRGIVHRDIKPDNLFLLNQSGVRLHVRVLDFGIARIYRDDDPAPGAALTHVGAVLGTPRYMSPEQLAGTPADARSDLYSTALVIFEALTGQLPYAGGPRLTERCPEAGPALQALLEQCLRPDPADRPANALEVYLRLQELSKASGVLLLPPGTLDRLLAARRPEPAAASHDSNPGQPPRRRWLAGGILLATLLLGCLVGWYLLTEPTFPPGEESLLGIRIGTPLDAIESRLPNLSRIDRGDPWQLPRTRDVLGHALVADDLGLGESERGQLTVRRSHDDSIAVLLHLDRVVAVVTRHRGARTRRGVGPGSDLGLLYRRYDHRDDLRPQVDSADLADGGHVEVRRYPTLGVGFEIAAGKVTRLTLFPSRP